MTDDDFKQKVQDALEELSADVASCAKSLEDAERELDDCKALCELVLMASEMEWPVAAEERLRRDETLIALWPEACRRADVPVTDMPVDFMRRIASLVGRPS